MPLPLNTIKVLGEIDVSHYVNLFSNIEDADWMGEFAAFSKKYIPFFGELERLPLMYSAPYGNENETIEQAASQWSINNLMSYMNNTEFTDVTMKGELYDKYYDEKFFTDINNILTNTIGKGIFTMFLFNLMNPHSKIEPHSDERTGDKKRIHIPIITHPDIKLFNNGDEIHMETGKVYLIDHTKEHSVDNPTDCERIHLVIDWKLNDE